MKRILPALALIALFSATAYAAWTPKVLNALGTTVVAISAAAGEISLLQCYNPNSSQAYVQIFNVASGSVTLGTTVPTLSVAIAPTSTGGFVQGNPGVTFSTAMSIAASTTATGNTANGTALDCNVAYH